MLKGSSLECKNINIQEALRNLRINGFTSLPIEEIDGGECLFNELYDECNYALEREQNNLKKYHNKRSLVDKPYLFSFDANEDAVHYPGSAIVKLVLHKEILFLAFKYMEMYCRLKGLRFWYSVADDFSSTKWKSVMAS